MVCTTPPTESFLPLDATGRDKRPRATYVENEAAPHGMVWTHAEEVDADLRPSSPLPTLGDLETPQRFDFLC